MFGSINYKAEKLEVEVARCYLSIIAIKDACLEDGLGLNARRRMERENIKSFLNILLEQLTRH